MEKIINHKINLLKYSIYTAISLLSAIILPQIFHAFGVAVGMGGSFGQMFLPMYLPVLILAFKTNAVAGVIAGAFSPLISYAISGMPTIALLPLILIELVSFGVLAGLLSKKKINIFAKILIVQISSRIIRIALTVVLSLFVSSITISALAVWNAFLLAIPGYILQLLVVPYFVNLKNFDL